MPDNIRFSSPDTMQKPPGYSHVVEVTGPGRTVYFAGQLGIDKSGKMGANAREQVEIAFENVKAALASLRRAAERKDPNAAAAEVPALRTALSAVTRP